MKISNVIALGESKEKLKSLGQQYPEAASAASKVIRVYIANPKKPLNQIINSVIEETGINRGTLQKLLKELGFDFAENKESN